jgi:hypothetical protein
MQHRDADGMDLLQPIIWLTIRHFSLPLAFGIFHLRFALCTFDFHAKIQNEMAATKNYAVSSQTTIN